MTVIPATLFTAGGLAILLIALTQRVIAIRLAGKISLGDGGDAMLLARSRAHANLAEYAPLLLILMLGVEMSGHSGSVWLWAIGVTILVARILHAIGMDRSGRGISPNKPRIFGMVLTLSALMVLAGWALVIAAGSFA